MELEKSTTLAGLVWVAGVLAAILFQNVFASSRMGVILGILLAVVILIATYFVIDGIRLMIQNRSDTEILHQQAYEDKMLEMVQHEIEDKMVEIIQQDFEELQHEYAEIKQEYGELQHEYAEIKQDYTDLQQEFKELISYEKSALDTLDKLEKSAETAQIEREKEREERAQKELEMALEVEKEKEEPTPVNTFDPEMLDQMADTINKTTMQAAKLIVKYSNKSSHELEGKIDHLTEELSHMSAEK